MVWNHQLSRIWFGDFGHERRINWVISWVNTFLLTFKFFQSYVNKAELSLNFQQIKILISYGNKKYFCKETKLPMSIYSQLLCLETS